jgi:hypothetical protein
MKRILTIVVLAAIAGMTLFYACKKNQAPTNPNLNKSNLKGKFPQTCNFVDLSGTLSTQTLSNTNVYRINGNVIVPNNQTLTIPAGTVLLGVTGGTFPARLIIEQGGQLIATGTSSNPIIFTSDQPAGSRAPGDWGGIAIGGQAPTNRSSITFPGPSAPYILNGGGSTPTDNSGTLEYVQINFAGNSNTSDPDSYSALTLFGVGTGTTTDHVQVNESGIDGIATLGGTVKESYMVSYNAKNTDFQYSDGYTGNAQFLAAMSLNNSNTPSVASYGVNVTNRIAGASTATPLTKPTLSNISVLGPNFCNASTVSTNYVAAIRFSFNGTGKVYNSIFSSWNSPSASPAPGLLIDDAASIAATASSNLLFSYNSFDNSGSTPYSSGAASWSGSSGCTSTMAAWITSPGIPPCRQTGNEFSVTTLGYDDTFCDDFCGNGFSSNFVLGTTTLSSPNFGWDSGSAFSHVNYRGAFGATDFTQSWAQWCPQSVVYCN